MLNVEMSPSIVLFFVLKVLFGGTALTTLVLGAKWRWQGVSFPWYPGEVFLCVLSLGILHQGLASAVMFVLGYQLLIFPSAFIVIMISWIAASWVADMRWRIALILLGFWSVLFTSRLASLVMLATIIVVACIDWRKAKAYPWTHWLGITLGVISFSFPLLALVIMQFQSAPRRKPIGRTAPAKQVINNEVTSATETLSYMAGCTFGGGESGTTGLKSGEGQEIFDNIFAFHRKGDSLSSRVATGTLAAGCFRQARASIISARSFPRPKD